ncbi:hypothetical protein WDU94_010973 [Cyamophila willieti]
MNYPITTTFITHLLLLDTARYSLSSPIDFQVGGYLHKFFKGILPNNTGFQRKPGHEDPFRKYSVETTTFQIPNIEGLTFKLADHDFPTFDPRSNVTISFYNPHSTTNGTTPSRESLLKMGNAFKEIFSRKCGVFKDAYNHFREFLKQDKSTVVNDNGEQMFNNYDDKLGNAMSNAAKKMFKRVDDLYTKKDDQSTLPTNFVNDIKNIYKNQMKNLFTTARPTTAQASRFISITLPKDIQKMDEKHMGLLGELEGNFANKSIIDANLGNLYTPAPGQW